MENKLLRLMEQTQDLAEIMTAYAADMDRLEAAAEQAELLGVDLEEYLEYYAGE